MVANVNSSGFIPSVIIWCQNLGISSQLNFKRPSSMAFQDTTSLGARVEQAHESELIRPDFTPMHIRKQRNCFIWKTLLCEACNEDRPSRHILLRHFIKQLDAIPDVPTFDIRIYQMVVDEYRIGRGFGCFYELCMDCRDFSQVRDLHTLTERGGVAGGQCVNRLELRN
ncbi:zinc finger and BTB domain-containing protein 18 [Striga asiatica]|uniref:Zinc finger and BTB domain-containing protein 18 n=1 Tax=Striga asiatica TaxID=4170 RepID=A0A5A7RHJ9_STRAF|nr:zinc finger and BTB domain-containing protein 18 [Striga asiatica]